MGPLKKNTWSILKNLVHINLKGPNYIPEKDF